MECYDESPKGKLINAIVNAVEAFKEETGMVVKEITIDTIDRQPAGFACSDYMITKVNVIAK